MDFRNPVFTVRCCAQRGDARPSAVYPSVSFMCIFHIG